MKTLAIEETRQVVDILFKEFISKIQIGGIKWELEFITHEMPNLCFKQLTGSVVKQYITGESVVELPFAVYYRARAASANEILALSQPLNDIANLFYKEEQNNFEYLKTVLPKNIEPQELRMTSTPTLEDGIKNNTAIFKAIYTFRYRKGK